MRFLNNLLTKIAGSANYYCYCYEIHLTQGDKLYLTSSNLPLTIMGQEFLPHSGLTIMDANFNDSAQNQIMLRGIFEERGITNFIDLIDAKVIILVYKYQSIKNLASYICTSYYKYDAYFEMVVEAETIKYRQSLLKTFSKTCRANFGDGDCMIDKNRYAINAHVQNINGKLATINDTNHENGHFTGGRVTFNYNGWQSRVVQHYRSGNSVILELGHFVPPVVSLNINVNNIVTLTPGCDKKISTCIKRYNNAINFRGEPLIPNDDVIHV